MSEYSGDEDSWLIFCEDCRSEDTSEDNDESEDKSYATGSDESEDIS